MPEAGTRKESADVPHCKVTSMSQAAYFITRGLKLVSGKKKPGNPKEFVFVFEDPKNCIEQLAMDFLSSESRAFDHAVRDLRALVNASKHK